MRSALREWEEASARGLWAQINVEAFHDRWKRDQRRWHRIRLPWWHGQRIERRRWGRKLRGMWEAAADEEKEAFNGYEKKAARWILDRWKNLIWRNEIRRTKVAVRTTGGRGKTEVREDPEKYEEDPDQRIFGEASWDWGDERQRNNRRRERKGWEELKHRKLGRSGHSLWLRSKVGPEWTNKGNGIKVMRIVAQWLADRNEGIQERGKAKKEAKDAANNWLAAREWVKLIGSQTRMIFLHDWWKVYGNYGVESRREYEWKRRIR